jgi:hypothetical protein
MVEAKFGGPPTIDFLNAPVAIDNRNGTVTAPQHTTRGRRPAALSRTITG